MMRLTYICKECGAKARRDGSRYSTPATPVRCPNGHGAMMREDGWGQPREYTPPSASIGLNKR